MRVAEASSGREVGESRSQGERQAPMASGGRQARPADGARRPDWSALPDLPLVSIAHRLLTLADFLSFRCVCVSWRSVGKAVEGEVMATHPPLLFEYSLSRFYHPAEKRVYKRAAAVKASVTGFSHGYLILARDRVPWLSNPLTGAENHCFPRAEVSFGRAILSSPPTSPDCVLVAYDSYTIQYCRPEDREWCMIYQPRDRMRNPINNVNCVSIVRGKGYVLLRELGLATFDFTGHSKLTILNVQPVPIQVMGMHSDVFLAESKGELYAFYPGRLYVANQFVVFRFDCLSCKWVRSENLGGVAVFVDRWRRSIFVDNYAKWGGSKDCIYFFGYDGWVREYKIKNGRSEPFLFPTKKPFIDGSLGVWVLASLS